MAYCKLADGSAVTKAKCGADEVQIEYEEYKQIVDSAKDQESASRQWEKMPVWTNDPSQAYYGSTTTGSTGSTGYYRQDTAASYVNTPQILWANDPDEFKSLAKTLNNIPGFDNDGDIEDVSRKFESFLEMMSRSGLRMNPFEGLNYFEEIAKKQGYKGPDDGRGGGPRTTTTVALTNEFDAEALVNASLNSYLGRDATEDEIEEFYQKLNKAERKNPRVTTTSESGSSSRGGYNSTLAAEKFAETRDDYAETQAQVTLKGLMEQAIRGRMSGTLEGML